MTYKFTVTTAEGEHQATTFKAAKRIAAEHGPGARIKRIHERQLIAYRSRMNGIEKTDHI
ncbi:MAG: hypothetical protein A2Y38_12110 [Spirochaetes bacterium GWB1_59_5]|nr:MAG: hypothetical protein A2Y38_12110 [Spirochaetes bacterium GWB1_59_5]